MTNFIKRKYGLFLGCIFQAIIVPVAVWCQSHPRGMITIAEAETIRKKGVQHDYYTQKIKSWQANKVGLLQMPCQITSAKTAYEAERQLEKLAMRYTITADKAYASKAAQWVEVILTDTLVWQNSLVKGLTRAALLRSVATAYDLCYDAWPEDLRSRTSQALFETARSLHSLMGTEANFALESNWMGVRYAAVLYALCISDFTGRVNGKQSEQQLMLWDAGERLKDHIKANMNPNGWSGESLGYHYYSWSFIAPALMAYEHHTLGKGKALPVLAPYCANAIATHATVIAYLQGMGRSRALKPDFSDDNVGVRPEFFLQAFRIYPDSLHAPLRWLADAIGDEGNEEAIFYKLAWYPFNNAPVNPASVGWLRTVEPAQGVIAFRNRFQDSTDIVAAFTTTAKRIRAHQSGDNLSFRLLGLDNIWVVGGGRTGLKAGQPTVFASDSISLKDRYQGGAIGQLLQHGFYQQGGGYALGKGSCMGVNDHQRFFEVLYDSAATGAAAVLRIADRSSNGKTWRLTTPEWNKVTTLPDGFLITAPNGATLKATVLQAAPVQVRTSAVPYNGTTTENASGIPYKGRQYPLITAIDVSMQQAIEVVLTLQPAGKTQPVVQRNAMQQLQVGKKELNNVTWEISN